jgi:long-subunit acyl-CoA synthetase (AMP-forming)
VVGAGGGFQRGRLWKFAAGAIPGCEVKLADDGEVICRGGNVFQGYLKEDAKTAKALDADKWIHSGDIGEIEADGYLKIVDRKKTADYRWRQKHQSVEP